MQGKLSVEVVATLLKQLLARIRADRSSRLALMELRLEATRRPALHAEPTRFFTAQLDGNSPSISRRACPATAPPSSCSTCPWAA